MEKNMSLKKRIILTIIALIGFLTSVKLSSIYIDANFNPYALSSFCSINELIDCDGVAKTVHSQCFGIPLAFWGLFLYFIFLFFTYVDKLYEIKIGDFRPFAFTEVFKNPESYISALGIIAFCLSMSLAFISVFEIHKICVLCFFTYCLNLVIGLYSKPKHENYLQVFKTSFVDFIDALKIKKYAIAFVVVVLAAIGVLTYTTLSEILTPQLRQQKEMQEFSVPDATKYDVSGNMIGDKDAKIVVHIYTDYQCPYCFVLNTVMLRAVNELSGVRFVHHHLPLDMECNSALTSQIHAGSCNLAKYAIAAQKQGKYWEMNNYLFEENFETDEDIINEVNKLGMDAEKFLADINSKEIEQELKKEIKEANDYGIEGTPAYRINMEVHIGIVPYEDFKAKLVKLGAKERQ